MPNRGVLVLAAGLLVALAMYASVGSFARYTADDYCWAGILDSQGFLQAQVHWYTVYSPRYAFTFVVNVIELAGPRIVPLLPTAAIVAWVAASAWALLAARGRFLQPPLEPPASRGFLQGAESPVPSRAERGDIPAGHSSALPSRSAAAVAERGGEAAGAARGALHRPAGAVLLSLLVVFATLQTAPDRAQSLYWQTGMLTYVLPLILATVYVGWVARAVRRAASGQPWAGWRLGLSAGLTFVAGGLSEAYLIPQNVGLTLVAVGCLLIPFDQPATRRAALVHVLAGLAGGVAGLAVILLAPATASRVGGPPADLWLASAASIATAAVQGGQLARHFPLTVLLCLAVPALLGRRRPTPRALALVTGLIALTLPFCYFPSFYAQNGNPPARSLIVPQVLFIGWLVYVGQAIPPIGRWSGVVAVALAVVPLLAAGAALPERANAAQYAILWDEEDRTIRAARDAGARNLIVGPLPANLGENFVTTDPRSWFNACVARYYGLDSIAASAPG